MDVSLPPKPCSGGARQGRLFVVSGPSGAGKTTLRQRLLDRYPDMVYSVSYTTRKPRAGEVEGVDYHFLDVADFRRGIAADRWAEWAEVHGNFYGTAAEPIERHIRHGRDVLLDIDVQGARQVVAKYPDSITIFVMPPSLEVLRQRMESRATDSPHVIRRRLENAAGEIRQKDFYRHIVVNDRLDNAVDTLAAIVAQSCRHGRS